MTKADIGIFGGSGFYQLIENAKELGLNTPYGKPSEKVALGEIAGKKVAFIARHGKGHKFPPHKIPFKANLWAMKELGVKFLVSPCAAGSLQPHIKRADFVICDQFVDRTRSRQDTYYDGPQVAHIGMADPYCPYLREVAGQTAQMLKIPHHKTGTVVVIQGPRFSTKAESRWFTNQGWEVINMTQYPEVVLARELEMCFVNISLITDYDAGLLGKDIEPVSVDEMIKVFNQNNEKVKQMIFKMIEKIDVSRKCSCQEAMKTAKI